MILSPLKCKQTRALFPVLMLSTGLCIFPLGEFHQEFPPETSLVGDSNNSGEGRDQFTRGTDALHPEFVNYMKASWGSTNCFIFTSVRFRLPPSTLSASLPPPSSGRCNSSSETSVFLSCQEEPRPPMHSPPPGGTCVGFRNHSALPCKEERKTSLLGKLVVTVLLWDTVWCLGKFLPVFSVQVVAPKNARMIP